MNPQQLMMMQGIPQIQTPQIPQPQMIQNQGQPQQGIGSSILDGVSKFITNFRNQSDMEKQRAATDSDRDLKLLAMGIPVDQKNLLKNMTKAGLKLDQSVLKGETPWQPGTQPGQQMQVAGAPGTGPQQLGGPQGMPGPPQQAPMPQAPQMGMWDRMKQGMGMPGPTPGPDSPAAQWLGQYAQQGQQKLQMQGQQAKLQSMQMDNDMAKQAVIKGIMSDDPNIAAKALDVGSHLGIAQKTPFEEALSIARKVPGTTPEEVGASYLGMILGKDKVMQHYQEMAFKMKDNFGGDVGQSFKYVKDLFEKGYSDVAPKMDFKQSMEIGKRALELQEQYPDLPLNIATIYAHAQAQGDTKMTRAIEGMLAGINKETKEPIFKTKGQIEAGFKERTLAQGDKRIEQGERGLALQAQGQAQAWNIASRNFQLNAQQMVANVGGKQFDDYYRMMTQKDAPAEQVAMAQQGIVDIMNKMGQIKVPAGVDAQGKPVEISLSPGDLKLEDVPSFFNALIPWGTKAQQIVPDTHGSTFSSSKKPSVKDDFYSKTYEAWQNSPQVKASDFSHFNSTY